MRRVATPFVALAFLLTACGTAPSDRTLSGAGLAAAGGAVLGAVTGLGIVPGIVIGAVGGGVPSQSLNSMLIFSARRS